MQEQINTLLETIKADYMRRDPHIEMVKEFNDGLRVETGKKYLKIMKHNSVWGFVVNVENDKKFSYGDILKAASYKAPERNHARGNLFTGYSISWTGPAYMWDNAQRENEAATKLAGLDKV